MSWPWITAGAASAFLPVLCRAAYWLLPTGDRFEFDHLTISKGEDGTSPVLRRLPGSFGKTLKAYSTFFEKLILVASATIAFLGQGLLSSSRQLWGIGIGVPLILLGFSVLGSLLFLGFTTVFYETYLHERYKSIGDTLSAPLSSLPAPHGRSPYKRSKYSLILGFGYWAFLQFAVAYVWLAMALALRTLSR